jgi:hypothetical protein
LPGSTKGKKSLNQDNQCPVEDLGQAPPKFRFEVFQLSESISLMELGVCHIDFFVSHYRLCFGTCPVDLKKSNLGSSWIKIPLTEIT